jgi:hypothetical protein
MYECVCCCLSGKDVQAQITPRGNYRAGQAAGRLLLLAAIANILGKTRTNAALNRRAAPFPLAYLAFFC